MIPVDIKQFRGLLTVGDETERSMEFFSDCNNVEVRDGIVYPVKAEFTQISAFKNAVYYNKFPLFTNPNAPSEVQCKNVDIFVKKNDNGTFSVTAVVEESASSNDAIFAEIVANEQAIQIIENAKTDENYWILVLTKTAEYSQYLKDKQFLDSFGNVPDLIKKQMFRIVFRRDPLPLPPENKRYNEGVFEYVKTNRAVEEIAGYEAKISAAKTQIKYSQIDEFSGSQFEAISLSDRILVYSSVVSYEIFFNAENSLVSRVVRGNEIFPWGDLSQIIPPADTDTIKNFNRVFDLVNNLIPMWYDDLYDLTQNRTWAHRTFGATKEDSMTVNYKGTMKKISWRVSVDSEAGFAKTLKDLQNELDGLIARGFTVESATQITSDERFKGGLDWILTCETNGYERLSASGTVSIPDGLPFTMNFVKSSIVESLKIEMKTRNIDRFYLYIREFKQNALDKEKWETNVDSDYRMAMFCSVFDTDTEHFLKVSGSKDYWKVLTRKDLTGIMLSQRVGFTYSKPQETKFVDKMESVAEVNGVTFAVNNNALYRCSIGGGNIMKTVFHQQNRIAIVSSSRIIALERIGNDLGVFTETGLHILAIQDVQGEVVTMEREKTSIIIRDKNDIASFADGLIVNTPFGLLSIGGEKKIISQNINNIIVDNYENSSVWVDSLKGFVYYITGTFIYRYSTVYNTWEKFNVADYPVSNGVVVQNDNKPYFITPSGIFELGFVPSDDGSFSLPRFTAGAPTYFKSVDGIDYVFRDPDTLGITVIRQQVELANRFPSLSIRVSVANFSAPLMSMTIRIYPIGERNGVLYHSIEDQYVTHYQYVDQRTAGDRALKKINALSK